MEKKEQVAYPVDMEVGDNARIWVDGDCMNSPDAPIRLQDGQRLRVHKFDGVFNPYADIAKVRGKVCVVQFIKENKRYFVVKEIVGLDEITGSLRLAFYYPQKTIVSLKIDAIEQVYIVDGVMD